MGKALERALWRMYAPHKVKLAVSGCPRNCAESGIKDVGVIGVDSGWEIYVAGNGGIKTEVAQFLVKVKTSRRSARVRGRVPAALSRGRLVSRAHRALRRARRARLRQEAGARGRRGPPRAVGAAAVRARRRARSVARDGEARASTRGSSSRWRCMSADAPRTERAQTAGRCAADELATCAVCALDDIPVARRARHRASGPSRRQRRRVPHRRRPRVRGARPLPAQGRAAVAGHRVRRSRRLPAAQLDHRACARAAAVAPDVRAARARFRCAIERRRRVSLALESTARWPRPARPARTAASAAASSSSTTAARITGVRGDPDHPANFGQLCTKGRTLHLTAQRRRRWRRALAHPLVRRGARARLRERVAWDDDARRRSPTASPPASASTGRTASRSTSPASS